MNTDNKTFVDLEFSKHKAKKKVQCKKNMVFKKFLNKKVD